VKQRLNLIRFLVALMLMLVQVMPPVRAQSKRARKRTPELPAPARLPSVLIVNNPAPEYLSGEVSVAVRGNENPIIRLGLAQNGVSLIEFPASDRFFALNPGNPELVTIEDSPTKATDRFFVLRPSGGFTPAPEGMKGIAPATSLIVQMNSGMVVTFLLYPAHDLNHNAHRCVVMYDPKAITEARRSAGLAVNLDSREESLRDKPQTVSIRSAAPPIPFEIAATDAPPSPTNPKTSEERKSTPPSGMMNYPIISDKEKWSKTLHGLKVATQVHTMDARQRQVLVTVRNMLSVPSKIIPGHPELNIQTLDEKGRVLQVEPFAYLKVESSTSDGMIAPQGVARYLLTYEIPLLSKQQRLCVSVAQVNAADDPVTMELTATTR
jgi:hypothetical protein